MMLLAVFERAALMLMTLFFLTRTRPFQRLFQKRDHTPAELVLVAAIFCLFAVMIMMQHMTYETSCSYQHPHCGETSTPTPPSRQICKHPYPIRPPFSKTL